MDRHDRPALRLAAAVREHVVFHGIHRLEAFVTDSEIRALTDGPRAALIAKRDDYQAMFSELIRDGIRDGSLRATDAHVATYAILLQCTGVALWFDPAGPLKLEQVAELHVELVLGSLQASRELIAEAIGSVSRGAEAVARRPQRRASSRRRCRTRPTIAVVAPASPPQTRSEIEQATAYFEARGHEVVFGPNHRKVHGYLAGTDAERAADLQWALSEPGIDMVHTLCGGYGCARLYDLIDWDAVGEPRIVCGFSDITALHLALAAHAGWVTFYGPNFLRFTRRKDELTKETEEWFHRAFQPEPLGRVFEDPEDPYVLTVGGGRRRGAAGRRLPHAAAARASARRTRSRPTAASCMVEDLNEDEYLVDTALNHLVRAGQARRAPPGSCSAPTSTCTPEVPPEGSESTLSIEEMLDELIAPLGIPAIANVPVGHGKHMATMPLGVRARVDGDAKTLEVLEAAVEPRTDTTRNGGV